MGVKTIWKFHVHRRGRGRDRGRGNLVEKHDDRSVNTTVGGHGFLVKPVYLEENSHCARVNYYILTQIVHEQIDVGAFVRHDRLLIDGEQI